ncbi:TPA: hypothetical protein QEM47_000449 [Pseudomonas putida]|uniref:hypothetical protein n=1 Tax=Pseudomonas putida TaxID=303 RepID=UPI000AD78E48|nr:hypothetical protein [Pseudomonas putida]MDD2116917.1 hypothetical protein [Pseudomonas putida]UPU90657.1 hypothetical protein M0766_17290 [Pseudomonas putida]HDS1727736.1 hypothetical protein [Pseudomonas putida]
MEKMDLEFDRKDFCNSLTRIEASLNMAGDHLWEIIDAWPQFSESVLKGYAQINVEREAKLVTGIVLGKPFTIKVAPVVSDGFCHLEATIVTGSPLKGSDRVVGVFRADHNGDIKGANGEVILSNEADAQSCELLVAVIRKVLASRESLQTQDSALTE